MKNNKLDVIKDEVEKSMCEFLKPEIKPILLSLIKRKIYSIESIDEIKDLKYPNDHVVAMGLTYLPDSIRVALDKGEELTKEQVQVLIDFGLSDSNGNLIPPVHERLNLFKNFGRVI